MTFKLNYWDTQLKRLKWKADKQEISKVELAIEDNKINFNFSQESYSGYTQLRGDTLKKSHETSRIV